MLKNKAQKIKKYSENDSQLGPKELGDFGGSACWGALVGPNLFWTLKWVPSAAKVLPMIDKLIKNYTKEPQDCEKELQQSSLFGAWPAGLHEALTINSVTAY